MSLQVLRKVSEKYESIVRDLIDDRNQIPHNNGYQDSYIALNSCIDSITSLKGYIDAKIQEASEKSR